MTEAPEDLDALVRRVDPDRWLASRFIADADARADVIALYAFNYELARVASAVSNPLMGEIRLAWWSEAVAEAFAGGAVRRHPVVEALAVAVRRRGLPREPLEAMVEARLADLSPEPFADEAAVVDYLDRTSGALMGLVVGVLGGIDGESIRDIARAWGVAGLYRAGGRLPAVWTDKIVYRRIVALLAAARYAQAKLAVTAFPAIAYATLARPYGRGAAVGQLEKRLRLTWAVAFARV